MSINIEDATLYQRLSHIDRELKKLVDKRIITSPQQQQRDMLKANELVTQWIELTRPDRIMDWITTTLRDASRYRFLRDDSGVFEGKTQAEVDQYIDEQMDKVYAPDTEEV